MAGMQEAQRNGKQIGRPRGIWKEQYKLPYGTILTRHCDHCHIELHPYASTLLQRVVRDKHLTEHSDIRAVAAKKKFFCSNQCKGAWIGKKFGFGNFNHPHNRPAWARNIPFRDPNKDWSRLSWQQIENLNDFYLDALDSDAERDRWLISRGYYNLPP
jgi:hypothetical protein